MQQTKVNFLVPVDNDMIFDSQITYRKLAQEIFRFNLNKIQCLSNFDAGDKYLRISQRQKCLPNMSSSFLATVFVNILFSSLFGPCFSPLYVLLLFVWLLFVDLVFADLLFVGLLFVVFLFVWFLFVCILFVKLLFS